jgi:hypothetical protein
MTITARRITIRGHATSGREAKLLCANVTAVTEIMRDRVLRESESNSHQLNLSEFRRRDDALDHQVVQYLLDLALQHPNNINAELVSDRRAPTKKPRRRPAKRAKRKP